MSKKPSFLFPLVLVLFYLGSAGAQQYPIMDKVAAKIVQKYQTSSCEQLAQQKAQKQPPGPEEQKILQLLHNDAQMRQAFINKIAAPIANKLFDCGFIP